MRLEPTVAEIMTPNPEVVAPGDRLQQAAQEMELRYIRHLPVVDASGALCGLLSERDLHAADERLRVRDVMAADVKTVTSQTPAYEAAYLILRDKIGCLPVVSDVGRLVGIVTESDFVRLAYTMLGGRVPIDELELEEDQAERV